MSVARRNRKQNGDGVVYERPAVMPEDPAVVAGARYEATFVRDGRARGVSWFHLSRQLGCTEPQLRERYRGWLA